MNIPRNLAQHPMFQVPQAAWDRHAELQAEEKNMQRGVIGQIGATIPRLFTQADSFILNPSNVGTGMIARMLQTDETIAAAHMFKNLMMISKIGEYTHDNAEIEDSVNAFLARLKYPSWAESLEAQASVSGFGFSTTEITSGLNDDLQRVPIRLSTYHPNTMAFEVDENGQITPMGILQFVYQYNQWRNPNMIFPKYTYGWKVKNPFETPTDLLYPWRLPFFAQYGVLRIPRAKIIHHTSQPMTSFGSPYGNTAVRNSHLIWQLKVFLMKQMGIGSKRAVMPLIWGQAPGGKAAVHYKKPRDNDGSRNEDGRRARPEELLAPREALLRVLADRDTDDAVVTGSEAEGYKVSVLENSADFEQLGGFLDRLDVRLFRAWLLPSLVMTDGSAGSRSLGDKHFQIVDFIANEDAKKFTGGIITDLIAPFIIDNFGRQDDYGKFANRPQNIEEREKLSNIYSTLTNSGWLKPFVKSDIDHVRSTLSLPKDTDTSFDLRDPLENQPDIHSDDKEKLQKDLAQFRGKIEEARKRGIERGQKARKK